MKIQNYRKIEGKRETVTINTKKFNYNIEVIKVNGYTNVYVSINSSIKPKALHTIIKNTRQAVQLYELEKDDLKIIILSAKDGFDSCGLYNPINNTVYYNEIISNKNILLNEDIELGHIERHEIYHYRQAINYINKFGNITESNYSDYMFYTNRVAKKFIDNKGINQDNVIAISHYSSDMYFIGRFDEVEAEFKAKEGA